MHSRSTILSILSLSYLIGNYLFVNRCVFLFDLYKKEWKVWTWSENISQWCSKVNKIGASLSRCVIEGFVNMTYVKDTACFLYIRGYFCRYRWVGGWSREVAQQVLKTKNGNCALLKCTVYVSIYLCVGENKLTSRISDWCESDL